ncbi:histone acetlytransferase GCN5 [Vairimorpha necatrix]|uniref:histone acetyltransferase n=1 Tax=Vairimorpha necatrix TaxID=6039 RepID=A0AAX4JDI6_9MICR
MDFFQDTEIENKKRIKELLLHENFNNGNMKLMFLSNSDNFVHTDLLIKLKSLFQRQLSKMPREYILRQIFDYKHINLLILNNSNVVIAGICYRPFYSRNFFEIVFCAVDLNYQVKGIGSFMMDILKEHVKNEMYNFKNTEQYKFKNQILTSLDFFNKKYENISGNIYFITYADNFAIGYFKKQGFRQNLTFDNWIGFIKDYEGGTIMECNIFWEINYTQKFDILENLRKNFISKIKSTTDIFTVHKNDKPIKELTDIPGIKPEMINNKDIRNKQNCLDGFIQLLMNILKNDPNSWPFLEPVSAKDVPEYYEVIKSPMDLSRIKDKFYKKFYSSLDIFISDVHLMLNNCFKFNGRDTQYYKCAQALFEKFEDKLKFYDELINFWNLKNNKGLQM